MAGVKVHTNLRKVDYPMLKYPHNWNNNLFCRAFTSVHKWDAGRFLAGNRFHAYETTNSPDIEQWRYHGCIEVRKVEMVTLTKMTEDQSFAITGACCAVGQRMVKKRFPGTANSERLILCHMIKVGLEEINRELKEAAKTGHDAHVIRLGLNWPG